MGRALRWLGGVVGGIGLLFVLAAVVAAATDRPSDTPVEIDPSEPAVAAYLDAEAALMAQHGLAYEEHTVELDDPDLTIRVLEVGDGPPVVIVPGETGEAARHAPLAAELDGWRLLLVNRPGGGASDAVDHRAVDLRELAVATLDAVYDVFGLDEAPIVANSVGGAWAWWYALERPERVPASAQLGAPGLVDGTAMPPAMRPLGIPGVNRLLLALIEPDGPDDAGEVLMFLGHPEETLDADPDALLDLEYRARHLPTYRLAWRSLVQEATGPLGEFADGYVLGRDELAGLAHPVLLLWPADDPFGDLEAGRHVAGLFPDADLEVVGVGHYPWLDEPAEAARLIDGHLRAATGR